MYLTDSWYWNKDAEARAWSRKFFDKQKRMPSSIQAADYSATLQYLKAVKATGTDDADKVLEHMKKTKINDIFAKDGFIRGDGRMVHDMYLMQVKSPPNPPNPGTTTRWCKPSRVRKPGPPRPSPSAPCGSSPHAPPLRVGRCPPRGAFRLGAARRRNMAPTLPTACGRCPPRGRVSPRGGPAAKHGPLLS